jgi:SM-20-related protein
MLVIPKYEAIIDGLMTHNFVEFDCFFENSILEGMEKELLKSIEEEKLRLAGIGQGADFEKVKSIRSDKIKWIQNNTEIAAESSFLDEINTFSSYLNQTCYTGITGNEFHYAVYEKGTFYKRHLDQFKNDENRKFSVITYLNKDWKEEDGGQLLLFIGDETIKIQPNWGKTVFLKSELIEHEVSLSHRQRLSITGWLR